MTTFRKQTVVLFLFMLPEMFDFLPGLSFSIIIKLAKKIPDNIQKTFLSTYNVALKGFSVDPSPDTL